MDFSQLDASVRQLCTLGLAPSTNKVYKSAFSRFTAFCSKYNVHHPFPVDELLLCRFIAELAAEGLAPATLKTYLAGIRHAQIMRGLPEPRQAGTMPRLKLVQSGVARVRARQGISHTDERLPMTVQILDGLMGVWGTPSAGISSYDGLMLRSVASLCFYGFFRLGELTVPSQSAFDERMHLAWGDVSVGKPPSVLKVHLKRSKCDQLGKGADVFVGSTGGRSCPIMHTLKYVEARGPRSGPFFVHIDGTPLTKAMFVSRVRDALVSLGMNPSAYAGHSFRIGAATTAARAGLEDSLIQTLGRWSSSAFRRYVRTPKEHLASYSRVLAGTRS